MLELEDIRMAEKKAYDDPSSWEYDGGSPNWTGDIVKQSPYMRETFEKISKEAFPEGIEAFQKQRNLAKPARARDGSSRS
jgi:hypothetical protein